jgi:hypothetical protein
MHVSEEYTVSLVYLTEEKMFILFSALYFFAHVNTHMFLTIVVAVFPALRNAIYSTSFPYNFDFLYVDCL